MSPASSRTSTAKTKKRSYNPDKSRAALISAAVDLFGKQGFHGTSMQEMVDAAGLTKGAFYHHFNSKIDVLYVIHDEFIDRTLAHQQAIVERDKTPHEVLYHLVLDLIGIVIEFRPHVEVFFREHKVLTGERGREVIAKRDAAVRPFSDAIRDGIESGEFRADLDPEIAALGVIGMCDWVYQWYRPNGRADADDIAVTFAKMALYSVTTKPKRVEAIAAADSGSGPAGNGAKAKSKAKAKGAGSKANGAKSG